MKKESVVAWISAKDVMNFTKQLLNCTCYKLGRLVCAKCYSTVHYCHLGCKQPTQISAQNFTESQNSRGWKGPLGVI